MKGVVELVSLHVEGMVNHVRLCYVLALQIKKKKYKDEPMLTSNYLNK